MSIVVRDGGHPPRYSNHDLFTLEIHHGGHFKAGQYVGGIVQWVDNYTKDYMSMLDLYEAATVLGYNKETAASFVDVDVQFEGFTADDECEENKSVEVVGDTIEGIDEEVTDSETEEDDDGVTLKFKDSDYEQSEEDDDKAAKNVDANDILFDQIATADFIEETHKELGEISTEEYNSEDLDSVRSESEEHEANMRVRRRLKTPKLPQYRRER
ncbi:hypothetical protein ACFX2J_007227 [Malus domestica]